MKKYDVYTHYDSNNRVIGHIIPFLHNGLLCVTTATYNRLMRARTVGGLAGIYSNAGSVYVINAAGDVVSWF